MGVEGTGGREGRGIRETGRKTASSTYAHLRIAHQPENGICSFPTFALGLQETPEVFVLVLTPIVLLFKLNFF